jgi:signal peptidase I
MTVQMTVQMTAAKLCEQGGMIVETNEAVAAAAALLFTQFLAAGGAARLTVVTGSMIPFLRPGDRVVVQAVPPESLHIGDILLLTAQPRPLLHRLLAIHGAGSDAILRTKGDAARYCDEEIHMQQVIGRVTAIERSGKRLQCTPATRPGSSLNRLLVLLSLGGARAQTIRPTLLRRATTRSLRCALACAAAGAWRHSELLPGKPQLD